MANNRQNSGRRRRSAAIYAPAAVLMVLFIVIFGVSVFFRITKIEVVGSSIYTADEIIAASGIEVGDNLFLINGDAVDQRIRTSKPYIENVRIDHRIPNVAIIEIHESRAFAAVAVGGDYWKIDAGGRVLEKTEFAGTAGLIRVVGFSAAPPKEGTKLVPADPAYETQLGFLLDVLAAIDEAQIGADVSNLDVSNISAIGFVYRGTVNVNLGDGTGVPRKLYRVIETLKTKGNDFRGGVDVSENEHTRTITE